MTIFVYFFDSLGPTSMLTTFAAIFALCAVSLSLFFIAKPAVSPFSQQKKDEKK